METGEEYYQASAPTGRRLAQQLTAALAGHGVPYQLLADIIYQEVESMARELEVGDWLELPDGTTATITWKPTKRTQ